MLHSLLLYIQDVWRFKDELWSKTKENDHDIESKTLFQQQQRESYNKREHLKRIVLGRKQKL